MHKLFIDTNIIIDWVCRRSPFDKASAILFSLIENEELKACTDTLVLATCYYLFSKSANPKRAREIISQVRNLFYLNKVDDKIFDKALKSSFRDFEDAVHYYAAIDAKVDFIITRNQKDYKISRIKPLSAEEYLSFYNK